MTNLVSNWLKLNELLDNYRKEERDITLVVHYNIQLDSILVDTFTSPNDTATHYAAVALPKLLAFPSAMVIFASLEKCSIILQSILKVANKAAEGGEDIDIDIGNCLSHFVDHYSHLQVNCPNIRRVCSVFCENLLEISLEFIDKSKLSIDCCGMEKVLESALFHTNLCEDYANFFCKKLRKTDHIQKLFLVLKKLGDTMDTHFYNLLPEMFAAFLNAYPNFQPKYKEFQLTSFSQFIDGLNIQLDTTKLIDLRVKCLSRLLESVEIHFRVFPNDRGITSAQADTFSPIISKLIALYPEYPVETARCIMSIQKINHILMEKHLQLIFESIFKTGIANDMLLNHIFHIYSKLNQLDKLVEIIMVVEGNQFHSTPEFNTALQRIFCSTPLSMCNKCLTLILSKIESDDSLLIPCEVLSQIISVSPVGELSNTTLQRDAYLQLMNRLNLLIHNYGSMKLSLSSTSPIFILSFYTLLDCFLSSFLVLNHLPFSRDWVLSIDIVDMSYFNKDIIPTNWTNKWDKIQSGMDEHLLERVQEIQLNILLTLSRFTQSNTLLLPITPLDSIHLLSDRVIHTISYNTNPDVVITLLQYWESVLCKLNHAAILNVSKYIVHYMLNNSSEQNPTTKLKQIITCNNFKEIKFLHSYLAYNIMHQIWSLLNLTKDTKLTQLVSELNDFYLTLIKQLDGDLKEENIKYRESISSINQLVSSNFVSRNPTDGNIDHVEILKHVNLLDILPLYYLPTEIKVNLLLGLQAFISVLGISKEVAERTTIYSTALLRGFNDKVPRSCGKRKHIPKYLCSFELFAKYLYHIADENKMDKYICYELFEEISSFLFERTVEQFNSLTLYTTSIWEDMSRSRSEIHSTEILLDLTRSLISRPISMWTEFKQKTDCTQGDLLSSLNNMVEVSTPILLQHLKNPRNRKSLQLLSVNLKYIFLAKKSDANPLIEEAIIKITRHVLEFIREDTVDDVITLESIISTTDTLRQYNHTMDIVVEDKINTLMLTIQDMDWISDNNIYSLIRKCILGLVGCADVETYRVFVGRIIDKFDTEYVKCCHLLSWMVEGNIPDTHRREIRKRFQTILPKLTEYLMHKEINGGDAFFTLRFLTTILKLPSHIGLSSRLFTETLTLLSLLSLDTSTQNNVLPQLFQYKSQCLYYSLHNYADNAISCIAVFLLLTKELIDCAFTLHSTELTFLTKLLEAYTTHTPLSNYTYHLIQQYILSAQKWSQEQATKKALKPSIFALIGFSKPETLLALQAQLDSTGRSYYAEMKEEYEKFYRFKGKT